MDFALIFQHPVTTNVDLNSARLMPAHIREAIRRYQMPKNRITNFTVSILICFLNDSNEDSL